MEIPEFITKDENGLVIREFVGKAYVSRETVETAISESKKSDTAKVMVQIAGIHEGITRNKTEYLADELEQSISSWTNPYPVPVLINHSQEDINSAIGRVKNVHMGEHNGRKSLIFTVDITDKMAVEKIRDGRYFTVSIGSRAGVIKCSICGNDWSKADFWTGEGMCEHARGKYYLLDEEDPNSARMCTWQIMQMEGLEISYVAVPSDANAMNVGVNKNESLGFKSLEDLTMRMFMYNNESVDVINKDGTMENVMESVVLEEAEEAPEAEEVEDAEGTDDESVSEEESVEDTDEEESEDTEDDESEESEDTEEDNTEEEEEAEEESEESTEEADEVEEVEEEVDSEVESDEEVESESDSEESEDEESEESEDEEVDAADAAEAEDEDADECEECVNLRAELHSAKVEELLVVRGIELDSDEATEEINSYEDVSTEILDDLIRGELARKKLNGLANIRASVKNPTLTTDKADEPHNPSGKSRKRVFKVKGSNSEIEIADREADKTPVKINIRRR